MGVGICYDLRFAELAQLYSRKGECVARVNIVVVSGKSRGRVSALVRMQMA